MDTAEKGQPHSRMPSALINVGSLLIIVGCFLPWMGEGDIGFYTTAGISIWPSVSIDPWLRLIPFQFADNGGLVILLIALTLLFINYSVYPRAYPRQLTLFLAIGAVALTLYHMGAVLSLSIQWRNITGHPQMMIGLPIVWVGSLILLVASIRLIRRES